MEVVLYQVFVIHKGNRKARWKCIPSPNFDGVFSLVSDHPYLQSGGQDSPWVVQRDMEHIVAGNATLEGIWKMAYDHT